MKKILSVFVLFILLSGFAKAKEINYYNKSWAEIKAKAKAENKFIFIDCYTEWCGWCKVMDKETMVDSGIIDLLNTKFVSVKMDMEKGEGVKMAMKYHITGFPSFMFFNADGEYVYNTFGYMKIPDFNIQLENAQNKDKEFKSPGFSASLDVDYPEFYKNMFGGSDKKKPKEGEALAFLDKQIDLFSEISWAVMSRTALNQKYVTHFLGNINRYRNLYGAPCANDKLNMLIDTKVQEAIKTKKEAPFTEAMEMIDTYVTDDKESMKTYARLAYYKEVGDWKKLALSMDEFIAKKGLDNASYINTISWSMYEKCNDKVLLKKACGWMKGVVGVDASYANLDTYAALLYKSGNKKEAELWANKAIAAGKKSGDETKTTEELLKKIKGVK